MAFQIVWTAPAQRERKRVLAYWLKRTGSPLYSIKLDSRFRSALKLIAREPLIGRPTNIAGVRVKSVGDHQLFYRIDERTILVLTLWDPRRDPKSLRVGK
jgi:toxin YoeB